MDELRQATSDLTVEWARLLAPHFGLSGSMDLDRRDWPHAEGPSYYNQFSHFTFLQLATGEIPGATVAERASYLDVALRNIGYVLSITAADFHTPHYSRGRDWGRHIGEWSNYYLLCSLELMERHHVGTPGLREQLSRNVSGAVAELHRRFVAKYAQAPTEFVGNHDTWHGLLFYRAGRFFKRPEWRDYAQDFFRRCVLPFQAPDGYWPEGQGIVVGYALVTAQAVSIYAELSGDDAAHAAVGRFFGFLDFYSFPDGTTAVVNDVRMRYHRMPFLWLPPGFLGNEEATILLTARIAAARKYFREAGVHDNGAQGFAFFGSFAEFVFPKDRHPRELELRRPTALPAARVDGAGWQAYLGWQLTPEIPNRFVLDAQNFVEVWHATAGYLVGTGGSRYMPRFSTIRRTDQGRAYIPDRARGRCYVDGTATATFGLGDDEIFIELKARMGPCRITAYLTKATAAQFEAALLLAFRPDDIVVLDGESIKIDPASLIHLNGGVRPVRKMIWRGLTWNLPVGAVVDYPVVPHNSYTQTGLPEPAEYVGRLNFPLSTEESVVTISQFV
ncbi:MAG: hypothetical protein JWM32_977 [Verrucomicrobia bacterium]|nr:hypothetical protein [Verrucomicrobiota bacterium]